MASSRTRAGLLAAGLSMAVVLSSGCELMSMATDTEGEPVAVTVTGAEAGSIAAFTAAIADVEVRDLDLETALTLVAMPLSCLDRPHAEPSDRSAYLDDFVGARRPGYVRDRAFYGCWDWHSAVNSTWAMVRIQKEFPNLPVGGLVQEKLNDHLSGQAMLGETEFFKENFSFERPYGWAWLLKLHAELSSWEHPNAARWTRNVEPLATMFANRMVIYLQRLERPARGGAHANTAFSLAMMLDYAREMQNMELEGAIVDAASRLYGQDYACPTMYEPWGADFISPCLEEAALMAAVMEPGAFVAWFDEFMPAVTSREFLPLTTPIDTSAQDEEAETVDGAGEETAAETEEEAIEPQTTDDPTQGSTDEAAASAEAAAVAAADREAAEAVRALGARSHLIGLSFIRADAMNRIAAALPPGDPRIGAYRKLAELHGALGFDAMFEASYAGSHWIGTFALKYLLSNPQS